jgi:hypothetical protein
MSSGRNNTKLPAQVESERVENPPNIPPPKPIKLHKMDVLLPVIDIVASCPPKTGNSS